VTKQEERDAQPALGALAKRLRDGPIAVWATLREDTYETRFGDGYYAYVDQVFLKPTDAARAIERAGEAGMIKRHIRRYDLSQRGGRIGIAPSPTAQEPTTVEVLASKLLDAGLIP
jgi:hypothetical protein